MHHGNSLKFVGRETKPNISNRVLAVSNQKAWFDSNTIFDRRSNFTSSIKQYSFIIKQSFLQLTLSSRAAVF